ncbi:MAG: Hint domain-containing protein, partial [Pseudomonadota bacterium]
GEREVFASAHALLNDKSIRRAKGARRVEYIHLMFDNHQVIYANGAETESLHPGRHAIDGLGEATRRELFEIFPDLEFIRPSDGGYGQPAMALTKRYEATLAGETMLDKRRRWLS